MYMILICSQIPALKMHILWCRTDICSCKLSAKVSLILENQFQLPYLCKLNHISVCFIPYQHENHLQIADSVQRKSCFLKVIPSVLGRSVNFNIILRFLLRLPVFPDQFSVSCDYVPMGSANVRHENSRLEGLFGILQSFMFRKTKR